MTSGTNDVDVRALGLALGIVLSIVVAILALASRVGWGADWRELLADVYIGYDDTPTGALVGMVWAFADGLVLGTTLGWLYNRLAG